MDLEHLRRTLKLQWLSYYQENRHWMVKLGIWVTHDGQRRPSSSFILATLSLLEPQLMQMLPLIVDLNNNPDKIVRSLGLNFNPETELKALQTLQAEQESGTRMLPSDRAQVAEFSQTQTAIPVQRNPIAQVDEACRGTKDRIRRD